MNHLNCLIEMELIVDLNTNEPIFFSEYYETESVHYCRWDFHIPRARLRPHGPGRSLARGASGHTAPPATGDHVRTAGHGEDEEDPCHSSLRVPSCGDAFSHWLVDILCQSC